MSIDAAIEGLSTLLGNRLSRSKSDLEAHAQSETHFRAPPPDAVVYPQTAEEVSAIVGICAAEGCPLVGWGTGTSLEGQALAARGGVVVDFSRMNKLLHVDAEDFTATLQPGLTREELNRELRSTGLFFPVDPGANASLGGMASTRASGTTTVRYGSMRDNVLALQVVLSDGRIIRTGSRAPKSAAGLDLTALFLGAEGTLGLITEMTVRLHGQPESISAAICAFDSMDGAVETVITTIQSGISMARIEFVDEATARAFNAYSSADMPEKPHLLVEFHGSPEAVRAEAERFGEIAAEAGGEGFRWASRTEERNALWEMRHKAYYACLALRPGATALVTDICVPISALAEAVRETRADIDASPLQGPILGHVGDGNFHAILLVEPGNEEELATARKLSERMAERALSLDGTITGEHGIGMGKIALLRREHGAGTDVMAMIKRALDPQDLFNPGKLYPGNQAGMASE